MSPTSARPEARPGVRPRRRSHLDGLLTAQYLGREYLERRRSAADLARELGCTHKTILHYLARHGLPARGKGERRARFGELRSAAFLRTRYVDQGVSPATIAAELGCSRSAVVAALGTAGIRRPRLDAVITAEFLARTYWRDGRSTVDIAAEVGCAPATISRALHRFGLPVRSRGGSYAAVMPPLRRADSESHG